MYSPGPQGLAEVTLFVKGLPDWASEKPRVNNRSLYAPSHAQAWDGGPGPRLCPSQALLFVYNQPQALGVTLELCD